MDVPTKKNIAAKILPHTSSVLIDLGVIFDKYILSRSSILAGTDCSGIVELWYSTQNEQ